MPKTSQQNHLIREATRQKLLDVAMRLFAELGYGSTSIRKIASESGVSAGLLYHYYPNKEALLSAVFFGSMRLIADGMVDVDTKQNPTDRIVFVLKGLFETLTADRLHWAYFNSLRVQPAVEVVLGDAVRQWTEALRSLFMTCFAEMGRENPLLEAYILYSLLEGVIQQYVLDPENYPLDAVVERTIRRVEQGM